MASVQAYVSLSVLNAGQATIFTIGLAVCMVMCAYGIQQGHNTVGDFVMINAMMIQLYQPLNFMGMVYREIKQAVIDIETLFSILGRKPEIEDRPNAPPLKVSDGAVRFDNVHFAYEPDRPILKGVSFAVPAGHTVAIVGPSGAGKSTVSRLLYRFYELSSGRIEIDGQDIREVTQKSLRASIGMVPQDTVLFNDTIRYNIRYGRWDATDEEVEEAARLAQIDGLIRLSPKGYETEVGERGLKLSGGEKQRVAIARTILKAPPILLLDEATSALDSHTEKEIQDALERVSKNRTTLVIAHRLSTIVGADQIIVLERRRHRRARHPRRAACQGRALRQHVEPAARGGGGAREARDDRRRAGGAEPQSAGGRRAVRRASPADRGGVSGGAGGRGGISSTVKASKGTAGGLVEVPEKPQNVRRRFDPLPARAHQPRRLSLRRRVRAGEPDPVLDLDAARLDRDGADALVRLFLPRPGTGHAGARGDRRVARRRPRQQDHPRGAAGGDGARRSPAAAGLDLHERVQLPREPQPGQRPRSSKIVYKKGAFLSADLDKASEDNERNSFVISAGNVRIGVIQIAGLVARRIVCSTRPGASVAAGERIGMIRFGSRARRLSAGGDPAAGGGRTDRDRRRDGGRRAQGHGPGTDVPRRLR